MSVDSGRCPTTSQFVSSVSAEQELLATLEYIGGGFVAFDAQWRIVYANSTAERVMGMPQDELLGRSFWDLFPEKRGSQMEEDYRRAAAGETRDFENYSEPLDCWFHHRCFPRNGGGMSLYFHDITGRKRAEEELTSAKANLERQVAERTAELHASEGRFRFLANSAPVMIWATGTDKLCTWFNNVWLDFTGRTMEQEVGNGWAVGVHPDDVDRCLHTYATAFDARQRFTMEYRLKRSDGEYRWLLDNGVPAFTNGMFTGYMGSCVDITERKLVDERLKASEESLTFVLNGSRLGTWDWNIETGEVTRNDYWSEMLGYSREEADKATAGSWLDLIHPDDRDTAWQSIEDHLSGRSAVYEAEYRMLARDGNYRWILDRARISSRTSGGKPSRMSGTHEDITERKRIEGELRETKERLETMINAIPDLMFLVDGHGRYLEFRSSSLENLYVSPEQFIGKRVADVLPEEPAQIIMAALAETAETGRHRGAVYSLDLPQGTRWFELSIAAIVQPGLTEKQFIMLVRDVTERKYAEEAQRLSEERLKAILDGIDEPVYVADPKTYEIVFANQALIAAMGQSVSGRCYEYLQHRNEPCPFCTNHLIFGEYLGRTYSWEFQNEANQRWYRCIDKAISWPDGRLVRYEMAVDITTRRELERKLEEARDASAAANRAKSEFLATMSHEIRTPMNGIIGMTHLLGLTELTEEQAECVDAIIKSSESLLSLINDILDLSKIEAGKIELTKGDFNLRESICEIVKTQQYTIQRKGLSVKVDISATVPDNLTGDQIRFKQILLNLVGNAIKFTEHGGITVSADVMDRHDKIVTVRIRVKDTGIGISPKNRDKIFAPFVQADSSDRRKYGGTGLGLAICTRLTELMGGRIWVESEEDVGSTFFVQLPFDVNETAAARRDRRETTAQREGAPLRVLIADDHDINLAVAERILKRAGHTSALARNGREALDKWEEEDFDLILMDVQMPVMDGIEAMEAIREREKVTGAHIPIIALTARALIEERHHIMTQGFDGYVAKPFNVEMLFGEMKRCLALINKKSVYE